MIPLHNLDVQLFNLIHSPNCADNWWSDFCLFITHNSMYVWIGFALLYALIRGRAYWYPLFMSIGGFFFAWHLCDEILKPFFARVRPPFELGTCVIGHMPEATSFSFPSGHTITAFAIAALIYLYSPRKLWLLILVSAFALFNGYIRIYIGVHFPSDVLAGALFGVGSAYLWYITSEYARKKYRG